MFAGIGFQFPWWVAVPLVIVAVLGVWALVKVLWSALSS